MTDAPVPKSFPIALGATTLPLGSKPHAVAKVDAAASAASSDRGLFIVGYIGRNRSAIFVEAADYKFVVRAHDFVSPIVLNPRKFSHLAVGTDRMQESGPIIA